LKRQALRNGQKERDGRGDARRDRSDRHAFKYLADEPSLSKKTAKGTLRRVMETLIVTGGRKSRSLRSLRAHRAAKRLASVNPEDFVEIAAK
jgi:hypothetical protein